MDYNSEAAQSAYLASHPQAGEVLENHPPKTEDGPEPAQDGCLQDAPIVPSSFLLWVDVNMSIKLKTNRHPEGEWVTLWCDDEPSPSRSEGKYFFWSWWKSSWKKNKQRLRDLGIPILSDHYYWNCPCDISIPYEYVVEDPYRR